MPRTHPLAAFANELGHLSDSAVAELAGVSRELVGRYRREKDIPSYTGHWTTGPRAKQAPRPGSLSDQVREDPLSALAPFLDMLGTIPDDVLAGVAGVPAAAVRAERVSRGLAEFEEPGLKPGAPVRVAPAERAPRRPSRIEPFRDLVGVRSDSEVARLAGVTPAGVQQYRRAHGIAARSGPGRQRAVPVSSPPDRQELLFAPVKPIVAPAPVAVTIVAPAPVAVTIVAPAPVARAIAAPRPVAPVVVTPANVVPPAIAAPSTRVAPALVPAASRAFRVCASAAGVQHGYYVVGVDIAAASTRAVDLLAAKPGGPWMIRWIRDAGSAL